MLSILSMSLDSLLISLILSFFTPYCTKNHPLFTTSTPTLLPFPCPYHYPTITPFLPPSLLPSLFPFLLPPLFPLTPFPPLPPPTPPSHPQPSQADSRPSAKTSNSSFSPPSISVSAPHQADPQCVHSVGRTSDSGSAVWAGRFVGRGGGVRLGLNSMVLWGSWGRTRSLSWWGRGMVGIGVGTGRGGRCRYCHRFR